METTEKEMKEWKTELRRLLGNDDIEYIVTKDGKKYYKSDIGFENNKIYQLFEKVIELERQRILEQVEVVLTDDENLYDEWWCAWYECPKCKESYIMNDFKYCPSCGVILKFKLPLRQ